MSKKYSTIQQHEPLRVPADFSAQGKRLIAQIEEIFDDLYRRFNRIKLSDLGTELQTTVKTSAEGVASHETRFTQTDKKIETLAQDQEGFKASVEQSAKEIELRVQQVEEAAGATPSELVNSAVTINTKGVDMTGGEINVKAGSAVRVKSGGVFELESDNFSVSPEGNVSMVDAVVSGNLSQDGYSVLTRRNIVISSTEPTGDANRIWVKPLSNVVLTYIYGVASQTNFKVFNTAQKLTLQGNPMDATATTYRYTLQIPYAVTGTPSEIRTVTATIIASDGRSVVMTGTLVNTLGFTGTLEMTATADFWLGSSSNVHLTLTVEANATSYEYEYHKITPGSIQLICTAKSDIAEGWTNAEVYVYQ